MEVYELNGELFENVELFLQALAHEYKTGDRDLATQKIEDYGFNLGDINVRPD